MNETLVEEKSRLGEYEKQYMEEAVEQKKKLIDILRSIPTTEFQIKYDTLYVPEDLMEEMFNSLYKNPDELGVWVDGSNYKTIDEEECDGIVWRYKYYKYEIPNNYGLSPRQEASIVFIFSEFQIIIFPETTRRADGDIQRIITQRELNLINILSFFKNPIKYLHDKNIIDNAVADRTVERLQYYYEFKKKRIEKANRTFVGSIRKYLGFGNKTRKKQKRRKRSRTR